MPYKKTLIQSLTLAALAIAVSACSTSRPPRPRSRR